MLVSFLTIRNNFAFIFRTLLIAYLYFIYNIFLYEKKKVYIYI